MHTLLSARIVALMLILTLGSGILGWDILGGGVLAKGSLPISESMSLKSLRLSSARSVLTYSSIPSINTYAYHTPGLVLLSEHQELTLTGNIIQFFQFPVFNNGVYNSANDSDLPNNGRIVIVDSWEKYLNVAEQFYISTIIIQNGGDIANASRLLASANGDTLAEKLASYISDPTSLLRTGDASVSGSKESGVTDKISSLFIQRFFTPINSGGVSGNSGGNSGGSGGGGGSSGDTHNSAPGPTPVNGSCGSANGSSQSTFASTGSNLCTTGTITNFSGSGPWNWSCGGTNSGTTMSCSANKAPTTGSGTTGSGTGSGTTGSGTTGSGTTGSGGNAIPLPTIIVGASPLFVSYSGTSLITWSSANANSCTTPWGSTLTGGIYTTPALTSSVNYTISCTGTGGTGSGIVGVIVSTGNLPLGTLIHDGPATPEQISLYLPVTGSGLLPQAATATVRYKQSNSSTWITGHPLFRIQPGYDDDLSASGNNADAFAWPLIGMIPGTTYNIEVTVSSGSISDIRTLTHTTKALPPAAGTANKTIVAGSSNTQIIATLSTLNPGDVLEFKNGTYNVSGISINQRNGTVSAPIYIRGESRSGVILRNPSGTIMQINSSNMIIENMTLQGPGIDSGVNTDSKGIVFFSGNPETGVTIRNMTITGVDLGIKSYAMVQGIMIYNNTLVGNNRWDQDLYAYGGGGVPGAGDGIPDLDQNVFWNDDGICAAGLGNVAFNNTLSGFGDSFAFAAQNDSTSIGVHFYRNEVRNSGDDLLEADYGRRNVSFYDNRSHNSMTALSLDPIKGGPMLYARNIVINAGRTPFKWNSDNAGQFILDNTIVRPARGGTGLDIAGWYAPNNGEQHNIGFQNNVFVYKGASASLLWLDNGGNINKNIDWTNNSWYPDGAISINGVGSWPSLASARAGIPAGQALFSGINKMFTNDTILPADPFTVPILLGPNHWTNVTGTYTPTLLSASSAKNSGVVIPNINDGYSGSAPDRGAIIEGIANPIWGDPSSQPINIPSALSQNSILSNLAVNTALDLKPSTNYDCPNLLGHATCATRSDYSRFTYDSAQQKMLFFGGGHGSTSTFMDNLDTLSTASGSSLDWVEDYPTTPCSEMILANMSTIDLTAPGDGGDGKWATTGHPYALHTYDMMVYHPVLKRLIILTKAGGSGGCVRNTTHVANVTLSNGNVTDPFYLPKKIAQYNTQAKTWSYDTTTTTWNDYSSSEYDPISQKIAIISSYGLWIYDAATQSGILALPQGQVPVVPSGENLIYYPPNDTFYLIATQGTAVKVYALTLNRSNFSLSSIVEVTGMTNVPSALIGKEVGWAYDTNNQNIGGGIINGIFHTYNPLTNAWSATTMNASSTAGHTINSMNFHVLDFDPVNGVYVFQSSAAPGYGSRTWAYKP